MAAIGGGIPMVNCYTYSGAEICLFCADSYLRFQGLVQFKVIAGLVSLCGHTFQPSTLFHDAFPLLAQLQMTAVSVSQATTLKQKEYAVAIGSAPLMFRQTRRTETLGKAVVDLTEEDYMRPTVCVDVELNQTDCRELNSYIQQYSTLNVCAVVVFRELRSNIVEILFRCFPFYCHGDHEQTSSSASKRFIKCLQGRTSQLLLEIPLALKIAVSQLADQRELIVMIMGQANTGKSTLARYIVNSLLNQHSRVAFLECDVGQTEFTPYGVVSLTFVTRPLIGPPCTHQQSPERAFFIGSSSPMQEPDLYICSINSLMHYFNSQKESMPLIVNTCGWLKDLGICIFWDLVQLIVPSHIIHLHSDHRESGSQSYWFREELVPINTTNCHYSLGWLLTPANSYDHLHPSDPDTQPHPSNSNIHPHPPVGKTPRQRVIQSVQIQSPETTNNSTEDEEYSVTTKQGTRLLKSKGRVLKLRQLLNKRKKTIKVAHRSLNKGRYFGKKFHRKVKLRADSSEGLLRTGRHVHRQHFNGPKDNGWRSCGLFQLFSHSVNPYGSHTSSKVSRELTMAVYFAQLNDETSKVIPWPELMLTAIPYEIKWHQLAVHCMTIEVPRSQLLCAINGMVVGLTKVDPSIIVDFDNSYPGMIKFLTERTPLAEYIGYGLVRGVDMKEKLFYITTPEPLHRLEQVNCLMLGKNDLPNHIYTCSKKHCNNDDVQPYVAGDLPKMAIAKPFYERPI